MSQKIIRVCAVDPDLLGNPDNFKSYWDDFGYDEGKIIARFPYDWPERVERVAKTFTKKWGGPVKMNALLSRIKHKKFKNRFSRRSFKGYNAEQKEWLDFAIENVSDKTFDIIISCAAKERNSSVIHAHEELDKKRRPWKMNQIKVQKTEQCLIRCFSNILEESSWLKIIDQHLEYNDKFFSELFSYIEANGISLEYIEIHTREVRDNYSHSFKNILPNFVNEVRVFFWNHENMHRRYFLTDKIGIGVDYGLGADRGDKMTDVDILDLDKADDISLEYSQYSEVHELKEGPIVIKHD